MMFHEISWKSWFTVIFMISHKFHENGTRSGRDAKTRSIPCRFHRYLGAISARGRPFAQQWWSLAKMATFCYISQHFMKSPIILARIQYFREKSEFGVPGEEYERCNHWKSIGITVLFACQRRRAGILWNWRKSWKFMDFYEISGIFMKSIETEPIFSLGRSKGWGAWHSRNRKRP